MRRILSLITLLLLCVFFVQTVQADCPSAMENAAQTATRAKEAFEQSDWNKAATTFNQAATKFTTASHSCSGEEKAKAKQLAAKCKEGAAAAKNGKERFAYDKICQKAAQCVEKAGKLSQQDKSLEAAKMLEKAAAYYGTFANSKNSNIKAHARAQMETAKANAATARANAR